MELLERLAAIEEIKLLKARYCRYVDEKRWDDYFSLFTEDAEIVFIQTQDKPLTVAEARQMVPTVLTPDRVTVHQVSQPEIEILSAARAKAIWTMEDRIFTYAGEPTARVTRLVHGLGRYHESYRRTEMGWRIESLKLVRAWRSEENAQAALFH
jgi:hypothetical protein